MVLVNEVLTLNDASGAIADRFVIIRFTKTFLGQEDTKLTEKLLAELPGIFQWAVTGWENLQERGRFMQPTASREVIDEMKAMGAPVGSFVDEVCALGPADEDCCVLVDHLYDRWKEWCKATGRDHPGTREKLGISLRALHPHINRIQKRLGNGKKPYYYLGIKIA